MTRRRLAWIPGDGVGPEVVDAARRVLEPELDWDFVELEAGWGTFERTGNALPAETVEALGGCDGAVFGAVGSPSRPVPGYRSPIVELRRRFDLYANLRPLKSMPVAGSRPDVDVLLVRENTEGLYAGRERLEDGGDTAVAERVITRRASRRIAELAFAAARRREGKVTVVHKANVLRTSDGLFREAVLSVAERYPGVEVEEQLVDAMLYHLIRTPERFDVLVAPNLYGDLLGDAGAALVGGLGLAPSVNSGNALVLAEPVHGSAPDIAGRGVANPMATILASALLLERLGENRVARGLERAVREVAGSGYVTPDLGGSASTVEVGDAIRRALKWGASRSATYFPDSFD